MIYQTVLCLFRSFGCQLINCPGFEIRWVRIRGTRVWLRKNFIQFADWALDSLVLATRNCIVLAVNRVRIRVGCRFRFWLWATAAYAYFMCSQLRHYYSTSRAGKTLSGLQRYVQPLGRGPGPGPSNSHFRCAIDFCIGMELRWYLAFHFLDFHTQ